MHDKIAKIQASLKMKKMDGWLLFDNHGSNRFARQLLSIDRESALTRRFFYWIPSSGEPVKIVHRIEAGSLDHLPGKKILYLSWKDLEKAFDDALCDAHLIAMEYSPRNAIPSTSVIDAGTMEVLQSKQKTIVSSADLLQEFISVLTAEQLASHRESAAVILQTLDKAWELITTRVRSGKKITEYDVQQFILSEFTVHNCISEEGAICAVNENTAHPHYIATRTSAKALTHGDFIMIDLGCKKNIPSSVYADITRVAILSAQPTPRIQEIFAIVKEAQEAGIKLIFERFAHNTPLHGSEVDDTCRAVIEKAGYGDYFTHRTGHSIDTDVHGSGAHLDNLETADERLILRGTCFSVEPGIYLPDEFGLRLETNLLIEKDGSIEITGGYEESLLCLL